MQLPIKSTPRPNMHISSNTGSAKSHICGVAILETAGNIIADYYHEVIIAVRAGVSTRGGAEEVDAFRLIGFD